MTLLTKIFRLSDHKEQCFCLFFIKKRSFSFKSRFSRFHFLGILNIGKYSYIKCFQNILLNASTPMLQRTRLTILSSFNANGNDCLPSIKLLGVKML